MSHHPRRTHSDTEAIRQAIDTRLASLCRNGPLPTHKAMRAAVLAPGKRLRPMIVLLIGGDGPATLDAGCAVEMIHAASLILDDLPAMDDAALRRGRPATHRTFGEASAILAAVSLIARAFEVLSQVRVDTERRARLCAILAKAIGADGMAAGQQMDVDGAAASAEEVELLNALKTAALFRAAARMGSVIAGHPPNTEAEIDAFACHFGLGFQIDDDALDGASSPAETGKDVGRDHGKPTLAATLGSCPAWSRRVQHMLRADAALVRAGIDPAALRSFLAPHYDPPACR
jgi:geranylgeranyl diphosphate synthase, type II